jgi:hypothetical protein
MIDTANNSHLSQLIAEFLDRAGKDPYLGTSHIAVYLVILNSSFPFSSTAPLNAYNRQIMKRAKIGSSSTYTKLLSDLCEGGYLKFVPSYYSKLPSKIFVQTGELTCLKNDENHKPIAACVSA